MATYEIRNAVSPGQLLVVDNDGTGLFLGTHEEVFRYIRGLVGFPLLIQDSEEDWQPLGTMADGSLGSTLTVAECGRDALCIAPRGHTRGEHVYAPEHS